MYISKELAKHHLQIDEDYNDDDEYLVLLIQAAEDAVSKHLDIPLKNLIQNGVLPASIIQAILLLIGNFYANREPISYSTVVKIPYTVDYLLSLYKHYYIP